MKFSTLAIIANVVLIATLSSCEEKKEKEVKLLPLVKTEKVKIEPFTHKIRVQGNIQTDQDLLINSETGGKLVKINVKEGQRISKGHTIAVIDNSVLASNVEELKTQLDYAEYVLSKQEELYEKGLGSEFELKSAHNQVSSLKSKLNSLQVQNSKTVIKAPFSGVIDEVFAKNGQMVSQQSPIARLVNNETVEVSASISEKHYARIQKGAPIEISFPNYSDTVIDLTITNVGNYIEPTNRTFNVLAEIKNNTFLLPNMLTEVSITDLIVESGKVIPSKAILKDQDNEDFVYITMKSNGKENKGYTVKKVSINVISKYNGTALINSDKIKGGDLIVVEGARGITAEDIVRIK